jgi:hypothetical protein
MKTFSDEQLSRVLSHAKELKRFGVTRAGCNAYEVGCINQVAYNEGDKVVAYSLNSYVAKAFDRTTPNSPDNVLNFLENLGVA